MYPRVGPAPVVHYYCRCVELLPLCGAWSLEQHVPRCQGSKMAYCCLPSLGPTVLPCALVFRSWPHSCARVWRSRIVPTDFGSVQSTIARYQYPVIVVWYVAAGRADAPHTRGMRAVVWCTLSSTFNKRVDEL